MVRDFKLCGNGVFDTSKPFQVRFINARYDAYAGRRYFAERAYVAALIRPHFNDEYIGCARQFFQNKPCDADWRVDVVRSFKHRIMFGKQRCKDFFHRGFSVAAGNAYNFQIGEKGYFSFCKADDSLLQDIINREKYDDGERVKNRGDVEEYDKRGD